jgi:hypothetical protein
MAFDVEGAKQAGYSDAEIAGHLATTMKFDADGARKAGYSDAEIIGQLAGAPLTTPNDISGEGRDEYGNPTRPLEGGGAPPPPAETIPLGDTQLTTPQYEREQALEQTANKSGYFALEPGEPGFKHLLWSLGAPFAAIGQTALGERPMPSGVGALEMASPLAGMGDLRFGPPRVSPMMKAYEEQTAALRAAREEAQRYGPPERPPQAPPSIEPPDATAASGIAKVRGQLGMMPDQPSPSPIPAEAVPPGVPPGTEVPMSLRTEAAINAESAPRPGFVPPQTNIDPLTGQATPVRVPPGAAGPATVPYAPAAPPEVAPAGTRSVGASASREGTPAADIALTPEQSALYGSVADKQWLYKSKTPGEADNTVYIDGINPTMAQREQTAVAAREMKTQRNLSPEADQAERELLDEHNTKRKSHFQETAGSDVTQGIDIAAAEKNIDEALGRAFSAGGEVNHQPITRAIQAERAGPSGKLPPVQAVMKIVEDAMRKSDGSGLETDPTQVYGVRRVINYLQSKNFLAENPGYGDKDVQAALIRVKAAIDGAIEPVAPGFTKALADYHTARSAFDVNEALQKWEPKLIDGQGRLQYAPMHRMMNEIIQSRDPRAPLNPWQSMPEAQLKRLKSLHDDLQRVASADELAKARGSDTAMNALDAVKAAAQGLPGTIAAGVVGHVVGGPVGAAAGAAAKEGIQGVFTRRAERAATEKMNRLLRPDTTQYPTRANPLYGPDAP